jgi:hypothetical protein
MPISVNWYTVAKIKWSGANSELEIRWTFHFTGGKNGNVIKILTLMYCFCEKKKSNQY